MSLLAYEIKRTKIEDWIYDNLRFSAYDKLTEKDIRINDDLTIDICGMQYETEFVLNPNKKVNYCLSFAGDECGVKLNENFELPEYINFNVLKNVDIIGKYTELSSLRGFPKRIENGSIELFANRCYRGGIKDIENLPDYIKGDRITIDGADFKTFENCGKKIFDCRRISFTNCHIISLKGLENIEFTTNIEEIDFSYNNIIDWKPLFEKLNEKFLREVEAKGHSTVDNRLTLSICQKNIGLTDETWKFIDKNREHLYVVI
jgi:hypothetical protein